MFDQRLKRDHELVSSLVFRDHFLLSCCFFSLGFGKAFLYLPLFSLYLFLKAARLPTVRLENRFLIFLSLMIFATVPLYVIGYDRISLESPFRSMMPVLFTLFIAGGAIQYQSRQIQVQLLLSYTAGIGIDTLIVTVYSHLIDPVFYGYGRLLSPYTGEVINSPAFSNNLAVLSSLFLYFLLSSRSNLTRVLSFLCLSFLFYFAVYLSGRTYFIILFLVLSFFVISKCNSYRLFCLVAAFALILVLFFLFKDVPGIEFVSSVFHRGLHSPRFLHYQHGLSVFLLYPLGGFEVDSSIEVTKWFHNVFLDNARLAGWVPVGALVFSTLYVLNEILSNKNSRNAIFILLFSVSFLVMQQDVIVEGNFRMLMVFYLSGVCILTSSTGSSMVKNSAPNSYSNALSK